jgi:hypothetical protein
MVTIWDVFTDWVGAHPYALIPASFIVLTFAWLSMFGSHQDA